MHVFPCGISVGFKDVAIVKFVAIVEGYGGGERDLFYTSGPLHHTVQRFMFLFHLTLELALWTHMYCSRGLLDESTTNLWGSRFYVRWMREMVLCDIFLSSLEGKVNFGR